MKALFFALLAVNLLVLAVGAYREMNPPPPSAEARQPTQKPELLLLSEREPPTPATPPETSAAADQAPISAAVEPVPTPEPAPAPLVVVEATKPAPVTTVTLPEKPAVTPAAVAGEATGQCRTLGPIPSEERATVIAGQLEEHGIQVSRRSEPGEPVPRYLVVIPAAENQTKAKQMVDKLARAGIKDVWLFYRGDMANAISLGLYSKQASAETRQRQAVEKGFAPEIVTSHKETTVHWLDLASDSDIAIEPGLWEQLLEASPGLSLTPRDCPPIVTSRGSP